MKLLLTLCLLISTLSSCAQNPPKADNAVYMEVDWIEMSYYPDSDYEYFYSIRIDDQSLYIGCTSMGFISLDSTSLAGKQPPHFKELAKGKSTQQLRSDLEELSKEYNEIFLLDRGVDSGTYFRYKAKELYILDHNKTSNRPHKSAEFITNAIKQGSRFIIVDSRNRTTKLREETSLFEKGILRTSEYNLYDCDDELYHMYPYNNEWLSHSNKVTAFTIDHNALNLKDECVIDLDKFALTNRRDAIDNILRLLPNDNTYYLIDRAEMTTDLVVVREITDWGFWLIT